MLLIFLNVRSDKYALYIMTVFKSFFFFNFYIKFFDNLRLYFWHIFDIFCTWIYHLLIMKYAFQIKTTWNAVPKYEDFLHFRERLIPLSYKHWSYLAQILYVILLTLEFTFNRVSRNIYVNFKMCNTII